MYCDHKVNHKKSWYNELFNPGYDFDEPGFSKGIGFDHGTLQIWDKNLSPGIYFSFVKPRKGTGHFTQLLWNATTNVGMGHAIGSDGKVYIAARYTPPGNDAREGHLGSILESIE